MARPAAPAMTEKEVLGLFTTCSNWGRWGKDDERGTLNYITPEKRVRAALLVKTGLAVSLGRDLSTRWSLANSVPIIHKMLYGGHDNIIAAADSVDVAPHGFRITHIDAIGHVYFQGGIYNGRKAADVVASRGMSFASVHALREGVFTRGVFLDVAKARGVDYLHQVRASSPRIWMPPRSLRASRSNQEMRSSFGAALALARPWTARRTLPSVPGSWPKACRGSMNTRWPFTAATVSSGCPRHTPPYSFLSTWLDW